MVLLNHGIFSFGQSARQSYDRMIALVDRAEQYLKNHRAWDFAWPDASPNRNVALELAQLRRDISQVAGFPVVMERRADAKSVAFARRDDLPEISQQGPATPDHVIRTKRLPQLGRDVARYAADYAKYFAAHEPRARERKSMLDAAPRVVLDPEFGLCAVGKSAKDATVVAEIYDHTVDIILRATALGGYRALPAQHIFDVEYWDLEQAKLKKSGKPAAFAGEVGLVTGAASGIGKACVEALLARGAAVVGLDINPEISSLHQRPDYLGIVCDVTSADFLSRALAGCVDAFGGLDILVLNAGVFPGGCRIEALSPQEWRRVMQVNLDAGFDLMRQAHPLLKLSPRGGRVVVIGSKNVPAPGPGAAAYSASKAALNQLARVAALEWAKDGIRINSLHPNAVYDTALWTDELLASRAKAYNLSVEQYRKNNLLKQEVSSRDVAELAAEMCGPLFAKTTASQVPVDGGNERVV
jgi:NAD(P)-dependent dehydrogenase (short-subunit alcohol dehydrogenase family)